MNDEDIVAELNRRHMYDAADLILEQEAIINALEYKLDLLSSKLEELGYDAEAIIGKDL
jgi:hypothetical protein